MAVWVIGDTHLSTLVEKPMGIFGPRWENHQERLAANWSAIVGSADCVIIAGDISWALQAEEAIADLRFLDHLPGRRKILLRGNHDYWWNTRAKVERLFRDADLQTLQVFQNEAILLTEAQRPLILVGTRGWKLPTDEDFLAEDEKIYKRECERLRLSLEASRAFQGQQGHENPESESDHSTDLPLLAVMHYPPVTRDGRGSGFSELLEQYHVKHCYYGHVHGMAGSRSFRGERNFITYQNVACDQVDCTPVLVAE